MQTQMQVDMDMDTGADIGAVWMQLGADTGMDADIDAVQMQIDTDTGVDVSALQMCVAIDRYRYRCLERYTMKCATSAQ